MQIFFARLRYNRTMHLSDTILDQAFAIYEEFGPNRLIARGERLQSEFPELSTDEIALVLQEMKRVSDTVYALAERGGEAVIGNAAVSQTLQTKHPFLHARGLAHAIFLVNYFAWHDGYDKSPAV